MLLNPARAIYLLVISEAKTEDVHLLKNSSVCLTQIHLSLLKIIYFAV